MNHNKEYFELIYNKELISDLELTEEQREKNIKILAKDTDYNNKLFIKAGIKKEAWENLAKVLLYRGYPMIADVVPEMFEWLQDMNWPGAKEISYALSLLPKDILIKELESATLLAKKDNDIGWLYWLREFMEENNLKETDFNNKDIYETLKQALDM